MNYSKCKDAGHKWGGFKREETIEGALHFVRTCRRRSCRAVHVITQVQAHKGLMGLRLSTAKRTGSPILVPTR